MGWRKMRGKGVRNEVCWLLFVLSDLHFCPAKTLRTRGPSEIIDDSPETSSSAARGPFNKNALSPHLRTRYSQVFKLETLSLGGRR